MISHRREAPLWPDLAGKPLILWGMPGAGKTTALEWLCTRLGLQGADTDRRLADTHGAPVPVLIRRYGWNWFRDQEHLLLKMLLNDPPQVIATGGGTPCFHGNHQLMLHAGIVVYLHAKVETLCRRLASDTAIRPLLPDGGQALQTTLSGLLRQREPVYRQAHWTFLTGGDELWLPGLAGWIRA